MTIIEERLTLLDTLSLDDGGHESWEDGACLLEAVSYIAGEKWSDHPECASPTLASFLRSWNDGSDDEQRQELKQYAVRLVGSKGTTAQELERGWMAMDWLARDLTPRSLDLMPDLAVHAAALRACTPITDKASLEAAAPVLTEARKAAWDAARAAARAAVRARLADFVTESRVSAHDLVDRMLKVTGN